MIVPGLGELRKDELDWYRSQPIPLPLLNGKLCSIILEGYDDDPAPEQFHIAIANLLSSPHSVLKSAQEYLFRYYLDIRSCWPDEEIVVVNDPGDVWNHVQIGNEPILSRRFYGDKGIYVSFEGDCDWEPEHGLQIVFRNGKELVKVGPFDGHLTNSDAYGNPQLEGVIYHG